MRGNLMKDFRTPEISDKIIAFCQSISPESKSLFIKVTPAPNAKLSFCGENVKNHIKEHDGKFEYGWIIWHRPNINFEAEAHSIWIDKAGERYDITPHEEETNGNILFLPDNEYIGMFTMCHNKFPLNRVQPCTESPLVKEYIALVNKANSIYFKSGNSGFNVQEAINAVCTKDEKIRFYEILSFFSQKVERNELCPCQSGLKYKKCCI
jgi:hypothetical protein